MNTVNTSMGLLGFQLHLGCSPHMMPPIVPQLLPVDLQAAGDTAVTIINGLKDDVAQAQDNLLLTKITQAFHVSATRLPDPMYKKDNLVMLSTVNRRHEYKKKGEKCSAKFFPRWDGPYCITDTHPEASINIKTNAYHVYHVSLLKPHHANDDKLFPS
jgi:hypothetical protein